MDATVNEIDHPDVKIEGFPTLKMFKKGDNQVIDYKGKRELKEMIK